MTISPLDLLIPVATKAANELTHEAIKKGFSDQPSTAIQAALEARLADIIAKAEISDVVVEFEKAHRVMGIRRAINARRAMDVALALASKVPENRRRNQDADWFSQWFEAVQHVSDEMVQSLWARAYAIQTDEGETTLSLRALDTLRLMQRSDVLSLKRVGDVLELLGSIPAWNRQVVDAFLSPDAWDALADLNIVTLEESTVQNVALPGYALRYSIEDGRPFGTFRRHRLTARGSELVRSIPSDLEVDYDTPRGIDVDAPYFVSRYANLLARTLLPPDDAKLVVTLHRRQESPSGRSEFPVGGDLVWDHGSKVWKPTSGGVHAIPPGDLSVFLKGIIGIERMDRQT